MATKSENLYVTQLPVGMTEASLRDAFRHYGKVVSARVLQSDGRSKDGRGESVALVQMSSVDEASWIVDHLNGNIPQGLSGPIQVKFANNRREGKGGNGSGKSGWDSTANGWNSTASGSTSRAAPYDSAQGQASGSSPWGGYSSGRWSGGGGSGGGGGVADDLSNLFVKGLPTDADELYLYKVFAPMGAIESVKAVKQDWGTIGFVKFMNELEAQVAMTSLNGYALPDGHTLSVSVKTSRPKRAQQSAQQSHQWQQPGPAQSSQQASNQWSQAASTSAETPSSAEPADEHTLAAMRECM